MAWCPNCKIEYVNGIETCNECGSKLEEFIVEEENKKSDRELEQTKLEKIRCRIFSPEINKVALIINILAAIFLFFGLCFSIYTAIDTWLKFKDLGQVVSNRGISFQQFITMFGRCLFASIIIFALGEGLQILHDIRKKLYEK
jgi:hypothetical protein